MHDRIEILQTDITTLAVDVIVNAANERMLGGGGVDGAIHRAAGPKLLEECRSIPEIRPGVRCPTGEARITRGYDLPAKHVIHTTGPVWSGGHRNEDTLLANCYRNSLDLAARHHLRTIGFPAISTGVYRFPPDRAAQIAVREVVEFLDSHPQIQKVTFACFSPDSVAAPEQALAEQG